MIHTELWYQRTSGLEQSLAQAIQRLRHGDDSAILDILKKSWRTRAKVDLASIFRERHGDFRALQREIAALDSDLHMTHPVDVLDQLPMHLPDVFESLIHLERKANRGEGMIAALEPGSLVQPLWSHNLKHYTDTWRKAATFWVDIRTKLDEIKAAMEPLLL